MRLAVAGCVLAIVAVESCRREVARLDASPTAPAQAEGVAAKDSRFGVDYVMPLMSTYQDEVWPKRYREAGVRWVNFAQVGWWKLEPAEPRRGLHTYRWEELDRSVALWQKHGFEILVSLRLGNGWFAGAVKAQTGSLLGAMALKGSDRLPADEHMDSYRAWIRALVERYDADGKDDMPGLKRPLMHYQIGNEYSNMVFWSGTMADYGTLLKETRDAARQACAEVKIVSNGIRWNDLFHGDPDGGRFEERYAAFLKGLPNEFWKEGWKRHREITEGTVALADLYDVLDAGGNGPWPGMSAGYMAWLKKELAKAGRKPVIWDAEARSEPLISGVAEITFHPELDVPGGERIMDALKRGRGRGYEDAMAWYRAEQAAVLAQVFVARFAAGFEKVFMGMAGDWDGTAAELVVKNPYVGLLDGKGNPWPAYYALKLLAEKLDGFERAERVEAEPGVELYRFTFPGRPAAWAAWLREEKPRGMDGMIPRKKVRLAGVKAGSAWVTPATAGEAKRSAAQVEDGASVLELSPWPVVIVE